MLERICKEKKRLEFLEKLQRFSQLSFDEILHMTGYLWYIGYSLEEVLQIYVRFGANPVLTRSELEYFYSKRTGDTQNLNSKTKSGKSIKFSDNEEIIQKDIAERYALIPDDDLNKKLFKDCTCISYGYMDFSTGKEGQCIHQPMHNYDPYNIPYYGSIQKKNSSLLVLDYDKKDFQGSLFACWLHSQQIFLQQGGFEFWDHFKFSGSEGFHLIKEFQKCSNEDLYRYAGMIDELELFDKHMFQSNRRIRGYCINLKSNGMSFPVLPGMTLSEIKRISITLNISCSITLKQYEKILESYQTCGKGGVRH